LKSDPTKALTENTFEGERQSKIVKIAKIKAQMINPNCAAEVKCPKACIYFLISRLILQFYNRF
jgi:hypothetical protein